MTIEFILRLARSHGKLFEHILRRNQTKGSSKEGKEVPEMHLAFVSAELTSLEATNRFTPLEI